ncbi:MAG: stage III sporulation protein AG [bacterium]
MGILDEIKNIFWDNEEGGGKNNSLLRNVIILGMLGTLLLLFYNVFLDINDPEPPVQVVERAHESQDIKNMSFEESLAAELEEIISLIYGVGDARVQIYASQQSKYEYEYNTNLLNKITNETDQSGGQREIQEDNQEKELVILRDSSGNEQPVIRNKTLPEVTGVFIVAEGAENSKIKYDIVKAVASLLDIPVHKISVLPYERG